MSIGSAERRSIVRGDLPMVWLVRAVGQRRRKADTQVRYYVRRKRNTASERALSRSKHPCFRDPLGCRKPGVVDRRRSALVRSDSHGFAPAGADSGALGPPAQRSACARIRTLGFAPWRAPESAPLRSAHADSRTRIHAPESAQVRARESARACGPRVRADSREGVPRWASINQPVPEAQIHAQPSEFDRLPDRLPPSIASTGLNRLPACSISVCANWT